MLYKMNTTMMAVMFAAAAMIHSVSAQGCISMTQDTEGGTGSFCFELKPKPSADTDVTCVSSNEDAACCNGGNEWIFEPTTELKCGSLMGTPTADSPATLTCSATGFTDGVLMIGPEDATDSVCDAPATTDSPVASPTTDAPASVPTVASVPTEAPTSGASTIQTKMPIMAALVLGMVAIVTSSVV